MGLCRFEGLTRQSRSAELRSGRQIQLPGNAEAVVDPTEALAETVIVERHQHGTVLGQHGCERDDLVLALAFDEEGEGGGKIEGVFDRAVDALDPLCAEPEERNLDAAFRTLLARAIVLDLQHLGIREQRDVEGHGCLRDAILEHQERGYACDHGGLLTSFSLSA